MKRDSRLIGRLGHWAPWRRASQVIFVLLALFGAVRHALDAAAPTVEASCPFGAVETAWSVVARDTFLRNVGPASGIVLAIVLLFAIPLGRVFCGWACPVGSLQSGLAWVSRRLLGRRGTFPLSPPVWIDRPLRWLKALVLGWVLWRSVTAVVPPLAPFCPYRTVFDWSASSTLSIGVVLLFTATSLAIERFWCGYLCPLGAILAPINVLSPLRPRVNHDRCISCGRCQRVCPIGIDPVNDGTDHPECIRCYACVDACDRQRAIKLAARSTGQQP